jgi:hypothetical protein
MTPSQIGMIRFYVKNHVHLIKGYLLKQGETLPEAINKINETIETSVSKENEERYLSDTVVSDKSFFGVLPKLYIELSAVFNPTYNMLNRMTVINNVKDKEKKVDLDDFSSIAKEIRDFAILTLDKFVRHERDLMPYKKSIRVIADLDSDLVDAEVSQIFKKLL